MTENKYKVSRYRFVIGALIILNTTSIFFCQPIPIPLYTAISADLGIGIGAVGYMSTSLMLSMSIMMAFAGNFIVNKVGAKLSIILAFLCSILGNALVVFSSNFTVILVGRVLSGIAIGLNGVAYMPLITMWFSAKETPILFSLISVLCTACFIVVYTVTIPLMNAFSSWHAPFMIPVLLNLFSMILWIIFGKSDSEIRPTAKFTHKNNTFLTALKRKDLWIITVYLWLISFAQGITSYFPTYLETMRGFDAQTASTYSSFQSISSILGCLLAGTVSSALGKRKPVLIISNILTLTFMLLFLRDIGTAGLIFSIIGYGFFANVYSPIAQTISTEIDGVTPQLASAAYSITTGLGSIMSFFVPLALTFLLQHMDLTNAIYCFTAVIPIAIIIGFFIKETGPRRRKTT